MSTLCNQQQRLPRQQQRQRRRGQRQRQRQRKGRQDQFVLSVSLLLSIVVTNVVFVPSCTNAIHINTIQRPKPGSGAEETDETNNNPYDANDNENDTINSVDSKRKKRRLLSSHFRTPWIWNGTDSMLPAHTTSTIDDDFVSPTIQRMYNSFVIKIQQPLLGVWDICATAIVTSWNWASNITSATEDEVYAKMSDILQGVGVGAYYIGEVASANIAVAAYQVLRGVEHSMAQLKAAIGSRFDGRQRQNNNSNNNHDVYYLDKEAQALLSNQSPSKPKRRLRKRVKDPTFYEMLNVPVDASSSQIKKAYYNQAIQVHPDKNSEAEATEHFQTLNSVYKTLISDENRELYDIHGACFQQATDSDNAPRIDPYTFFTVLFGSGVVEPYTGSFKVASIVDSILSLTEKAEPQLSLDPNNSAESKQQQIREVNVALHLRNRTAAYVYGEETLDDYRQSCRMEAISLAMAMEGSHEGDMMLRAIGIGLTSEANLILTPTLKFQATGWVHEAMETAKTNKVHKELERTILNVVQQTKADTIVSNSSDSVESEKNNEEDKHNNDKENDNHNNNKNNSTNTNRKFNPTDCQHDDQAILEGDEMLQKLSVPKVLKTVWEFNVHDITSTVRAAAGRVLDDFVTSKQERKKKALALHILGMEFRAVVGTIKKTDNEHNNKAGGGNRHYYLSAQYIRESVEKAFTAAVVLNQAFDDDDDEYDEYEYEYVDDDKVKN